MQQKNTYKKSCKCQNCLAPLGGQLRTVPLDPPGELRESGKFRYVWGKSPDYQGLSRFVTVQFGFKQQTAVKQHLLFRLSAKMQLPPEDQTQPQTHW